MAFTFTAPYTPEIEGRMRSFHRTLSEKDQRRFATLEAGRLGHGGIEYIARVLGCSRRTIERGMDELDAVPHDPVEGRVRRPGGGRKKKSRATPNSNRT
jgi:hypothetical protein